MNILPKPETNVGALLGTYSPFELEENFLNNLSHAELVSLCVAELERVAAQPATGRPVSLELLFASPQWQKLGQPKAWAQKILDTLICSAGAKAREAAILTARQNGTLTQSDKVWRDKATDVRYALPDGVMIQEKNGLWFHDVAGADVGPCVYPTEEMENGTIRFTGWDRWGRPVRDLAIAFADLQSPKKCQSKLSSIGARMDDITVWCQIVLDILSQNDLRVPDPEPRESANEELARIQAAATTAGGWLQDQVTWCPQREFEKEFGTVSLSTRRRWVEKGWLVRDAATSRYSWIKSRSGVKPSRHYAFRFPVKESKPAKPAPDAGLRELESTAAAEAAASSRH
jgi:hypothetical protein